PSAKLDLEVLGTGTLHELTVHLDVEVDGDDVALLRPARGLRRFERGVLATQCAELGLEIFGIDRRLRTLRLEPLVLDVLDLGDDLESCLVSKRLIVDEFLWLECG